MTTVLDVTTIIVMLSTVADRLNYLVQLAGAPLRRLDEYAQRKQKHLQRILSRPSGNVRADIAAAYALTLGADPAWVLLGKGRAPSGEAVRASVARARRAHELRERRAAQART